MELLFLLHRFITLIAISFSPPPLFSLHSNADKVDKLMADIEDQMQLNDDVNNAMSQSFGMTFDEEELDAELQALEEQSLQDSFKDVHVPQSKVCTLFLLLSLHLPFIFLSIFLRTG